MQTPAIIQVQKTLTIQADLNCSVLIKASDASQALNQTTILENNKDTNETELEHASRASAKHHPLSDESEPNLTASDNPTACEVDPTKPAHGSKPGTAPMQDAVSESGINSETANELSDPTSMKAKETTGPEIAKNKDDKSMKPPAPVRTGLTGDQQKDHGLKVATSPSLQEKGTRKGPCNTGSASSKNAQDFTAQPQRSASRASLRTEAQIANQKLAAQQRLVLVQKAQIVALQLAAEKTMKEAATHTVEVTARCMMC